MMRKWLFSLVAGLCLLYLVLLIPDASLPEYAAGEKPAFVWNLDDYWDELEVGFEMARLTGCDSLAGTVEAGFARMDTLLDRLDGDRLPPESPVFDQIESILFTLATLEAACPERLIEYVEMFRRVRTLSKKQSANWKINSKTARDRIYRLLYGGRTAVEEVMLQAPEGAIPELVRGVDEPSVTPSSEILGVTIHSGDILISRGGAPTSALIARGSNYPGNFSHAAQVHVDENTGEVSIVESHIEIGVAVASVEDYFRDTKLRVMVLRPRSDLPEIVADPMLPHKAAEHALERADRGHIAYDFAMDTEEPSKLFCSEVVSDAYRSVGVRLWSALSHISNPGTKSWLAAFGVRNFTTQEPSDLEYDPQVAVVAEWRGFETLRKDRFDNAVVDVMLEKADEGVRLEYNWYMLPMARVLKAYSVLLNQFGEAGPIPEGMDASAALRNEWFSGKHREIKTKLERLSDEFERENGYSPPYWELVKMAREAAEGL